MVGFVFFAKSPRHVTFEAARMLANRARMRAEIVALCVDADDFTLKLIVEATEPDYLQLHGAESPERVDEIQRKFGVSAIKATLRKLTMRRPSVGAPAAAAGRCQLKAAMAPVECEPALIAVCTASK